MGIKNVKAALDNWSHLPSTALVVLIRMAATSWDPNDDPKHPPNLYYGGWEYLAEALGRDVPVLPQPDDNSAEAIRGRRVRESHAEAVRRQVKELTTAGAISVLQSGSWRHHAKYYLNVGASKVRQKSWNPMNNSSGSPTESVGTSPTESVGTSWGLSSTGEDATEPVGTSPTEIKGEAPRKSVGKPHEEVGAKKYEEQTLEGDREKSQSSLGAPLKWARPEESDDDPPVLDEWQERRRQSLALLARPDYNHEYDRNAA